MPSLVDIPTVVGALVTFFASGGTDAAVEIIKGITVNGALKLAEIKDELMCKPEVIQAVAEYQKTPDEEFKAQLEAILSKALEQHPAFYEQTNIQVQGDITAEKGSLAAAEIKGSTINLNNTFND